ncbi:MAG: exo-alpha-sialidase, partial [Betaproteobacteria bacterium]|nr:exo-alpha-sialidase [Betaproteobacteria bacterium]
VTLIRDVGAQFFNDKNSITAHPTDARFAFATWDRLNASGGGPTYFARTTDGGLTWEPARPIYDPGPTSQTIGNEIVVMPNGTLINAYTQIDAGPLNRAFFAIVRSTDNGVTWSQPIRIADYQGIGTRDPETGAAIRDSSSLARIAVSAQGMLYLTWQDARFTNGARDSIALARSSDGGLTWSTPMRVNSDASTQALIPTIHVRADGTLGITHFDFRSNTTDPNTLPTDHWLLRSSDGGNTWREVRVSGPFDLAAAPVARGLFIGDYQALLSIGNQFVPVWVETNSDTNNRTDVYIRILSAADSANVTAGDSISTSYLAPTSAAAPMHEEWQRQTHERLTSVLARRRPPVLPTP